MGLIAAPPDIFALITKPIAEDSTKQMWFLESVVAFDAEDGGAYIVGGLNRTGKLVRLDEVAERNGFTIAAVWEQNDGGREEALEWARKHIRARYEEAVPLSADDPRWSG